METKNITAQDVVNYIEGNINYLRSQSSFFKLEVHIQEQATYRSYLCIDCLEAGECKICHCITPNMFYAPKKLDKEDKWGVMLDKDEWEKFKLDNNIDIDDISKKLDLATKEIKSEYNEEMLADLNKTRLVTVAKELVNTVEKAKSKEYSKELNS